MPSLWLFGREEEEVGKGGREGGREEEEAGKGEREGWGGRKRRVGMEGRRQEEMGVGKEGKRRGWKGKG